MDHLKFLEASHLTVLGVEEVDPAVPWPSEALFPPLGRG